MTKLKDIAAIVILLGFCALLIWAWPAVLFMLALGAIAALALLIPWAAIRFGRMLERRKKQKHDREVMDRYKKTTH